MNCAKCDYDLTGLGEPDRCPECGSSEWRPDPENPAGWSTAERVNLVAALVPVAIIALLHLMLVLARFELGRWPHRGGMDDPKSIPMVRELHSLVAVLMLLVPVALVASVGLVYGLFYRDATRKQFTYAPIRALMIAATIWVASILILGVDLAQVTTWFMD